MMLRIWIIACLLTLLGVVVPLKAQEPGYLGRRVWVGYDNLSNLGLFGEPYGRHNPPDSLRFFLNMRHVVRAEYAIAPRWSAGLSFQGFRTGKRIKSPFTYQEDLHVQMQLKGIGASVRWYALHNRGSVAPLGVYGQLDVVRFFCKITEPSGRFFNDGRTHLGTFPSTGVMVTFGKSLLMGDRFLWDFGFQTGFSPGWISVITTGAGAHYRAKLRNSIHYRTTGHYLMNFRAGLSIILF